MTNSVLSAENLGAGYRNAIVENVNLTAVKGKLTCLLGKNGSGKSTVLKTLAGLLSPLYGRVMLLDKDISKASSKYTAENLSIVLTGQVRPPLMTAFELVAMGRTPYTDFLGRLSPADKKAADEALTAANAMELKDRYVSELSDGELQKILIARAVVQEPEVIILDEPTSHLDIKHKTEVIRTLRSLAAERNIACIISLHDIDLALKGCDIILLTDSGRIYDAGSPDELIRSGKLNSLFDIQGAACGRFTGNVEFKGCPHNDVFVVCGGGTGIGILRALALSSKGVSAGVIHQNDADLEAAEIICSKIVTELPFEKISDKAISDAKAIIKESRCVVDSGFPVGSGNEANLSLISYAVEAEKKVISLRTSAEAYKLWGGLSKRFVFAENCSDAVLMIES